MHFHSVDLIHVHTPTHPTPTTTQKKEKNLKTPTLKAYDLVLLFCITIRELWTLTAPELGYSRKKNKQGGAENVEFPGVLKKYHVDFPGVNNKKNGISRGDREKIMWIFQGS